MTAPEPLKLTTEEARQAYEKAAAELDRICQGPRHGFRMQIPAHPDDSDLVLGEALGALKQLIAERDEAAELRAAIKAWAEALDAESGAQSAAYAAAQHEQGYEATYAAWQAAKDRLGEAEERLYALAAPEAQP